MKWCNHLHPRQETDTKIHNYIYKKHLSLHSKHGLIAQFCIRHFVVSQCLLILQHNFFHCTLNMTLKNQVKKEITTKLLIKCHHEKKKLIK